MFPLSSSQPLTLNEAWYDQLTEIMENGRETSPRGQKTLELPSKQLIFDMNYPVITLPARELGYRFMAAEAWWILSGRDDVDSIAPYSKAISKFSDDGHKFFGAYGPPIIEQLDYVVSSLVKDGHTRQAVLTTWRPNPPVTKDVPCTIAFSWLLRDDKLEAHVFMRSSDNWLGVPYDAFNFTMLTVEIARRLNQQRLLWEQPVGLGELYLTAASSHIYDRNYEDVDRVIGDGFSARTAREHPAVPRALYDGGAVDTVATYLGYLKDTDPGDFRRWWEAPR